jgi:hypothetical protein
VHLIQLLLPQTPDNDSGATAFAETRAELVEAFGAVKA